SISVGEVPQPFPVTWFRAFLQNPYLWALEKCLGIEEVSDDAHELDGGAFGDLAHRVLERFAGTPELRSDQAGVVSQCLSSLLDREARSRFGSGVVPAVRVQIEQLRARLAAFAEWHAGHLGEGWRVVAWEVRTHPDGVPFLVDGTPFLLSGRIDRIDFHPARGEWLVLDYKTGDSTGGPRQEHGGQGHWKDLQLPLYRHLLAHLQEPLPGFDVSHPVSLGFIRLAKQSSDVGFSRADWSDEELEDADSTARSAIRELRALTAVAHDPGLRMPFLSGSLELLLGQRTIQASADPDGGDLE
ncbi:PD-(D/E)XK nuclease family protein, partial [Gemmatimonadota bacterium]